MGGSGGGDFLLGGRKTPEEIANKIRSEEATAQGAAFDAEVSHKIRILLSQVNDRDTETIQRHLTTIKNALVSDIDGTIDIRYGGSVSKHTYVDGLSDIDSLALLNNSELNEMTPNEVKEYFAERIRQRLPDTPIEVGKLAITVTFSSGYNIQLLPAIEQGSGIKIPSSRNENEWSHLVQPKKFVLALRYMNTKMSGKLVPTIKLAKSIISDLPENRHLSGYHVESLAVEIFGRYAGEKTPKAMLKYFFNEGSKAVLNPVRDKSGQSIHVDEYLGEPNSLQRKMISDSFSTLARKMQNADGSRDLRSWNDILG